MTNIITSDLTETDYQTLKRAMFDFILNNRMAEEKPKAFFTGGLSGVGKSTFIELILKQTNAVLIDADSFRNYHPYYIQWLSDKGPVEARDSTRDFCDRLAADLQDELLKRKISFIKDGTLQLPVECPAEIMEAAHKGFSVKIIVLASRKGDGELSIRLRHWEMREARELLRKTDPEMYQKTFIREIQYDYNFPEAQKGIYQALDKIEIRLATHAHTSKINHQIIVIKRNGDIIYNNDFSSVPLAMSARQYYENDYLRQRTPEEIESLIKIIERTKILMKRQGATKNEVDDLNQIIIQFGFDSLMQKSMGLKTNESSNPYQKVKLSLGL